MNKKFLADFYENGIFHIYNRTNNKELLFKTDENRLFFLRQYAKYLHPFLDTFCWNLLPNHFHFLVRVKPVRAIKNYLQSLQDIAPDLIISKQVLTLKPVEKAFLQDKANVKELIEMEWKRFFTSYSMAFNQQHNRTGNLFQRPFKRVEVIKETHFTQAIIYIHANAQKHQICKNFTEHQWSSWQTIISDKPTQLVRSEVLDWFGGRQACIDAHEGMIDFYYNSDVAIEDD